MRVTKISAVAFKGWTFAHELWPVTLFAGPNWTGKSSRVEALTLALAGWLPGVANTGRGLFDALASGNPLRVAAELDRSEPVTRTWRMAGGLVKYVGTGDALDLPRVAVDATEFLGLSGPERVKFLFALAKLPPECGVTALTNAVVANVKNIKLEENTPESEAAIRGLCDLILNAGFESGATPPQEWLAKLSEGVKTLKLSADQTVRRMEAGLQSAAQVATGDPAPQDAEAKLADARKALETVVGESQRLFAELRSLDARVAEAESAHAAVDGASDVQRHLDETFTRRQQLAANPVPESSAEAKAVTDEALKTAHALHTQAAQSLAVSRSNGERLAKELEAAKSQKTCPHCGQSVVEQKRSIAKALAAELEEARESHKKMNEQWKETAKALKECQSVADQWSAASVAFNFYASSLRRFDEEITSLRERLAKTDGLKALADRLPGLREEAAIARQKSDEASSVVERARAAVSARETDARRLMAERAETAQRARTVAEATKSRVEQAVLKQAVALLAALQAELVAKAVGPLLAKANRLCGGVVPYPLAYEDGRIGYRLPDGKLMECRRPACSGTQEALAFCALSVALSADGPMRLVVLDELGRLDWTNKRKVLARVCELQRDGDIDQCVLVDTVNDWVAGFVGNDNFGVISL